ncbi:hypothetical protein EV361DRAFT_85981 [Lentinula raphanica]|nr:hypothetical protein EV361DRAFT_85981 [Lentinula raphanica]
MMLEFLCTYLGSFFSLICIFDCPSLELHNLSYSLSPFFCSYEFEVIRSYLFRVLNLTQPTPQCPLCSLARTFWLVPAVYTLYQLVTYPLFIACIFCIHCSTLEFSVLLSCDVY